MNTPNPTALCLRGHVEGAERTYLLRRGLNRLGRLAVNQVILQVDGVSRCHAALHLDRHGARLEDLASKNGCFVNDRRVHQATLQAGDRIRLGPVELELQEAALDDDSIAIELDEESWAESVGASDPTVEAAGPDRLSPEPPRGVIFPPGYLPGRAPAMRALYRLVGRLAASDLPVLVLGETGVGKEAIARMLHLSSGRPGAFVAVSCAAIPKDLLEAELFGINDRVATGVAGRSGKLSAAAGGTILLDEIGEMPQALQSKLLRTLQEGEVEPVGGTAKSTDVRVIAATHAAPSERLRPDLYYRLAGSVLRVPPLRDRREDIPALVQRFLSRAARETHTRVRGITSRALQRLLQRDWPGNIRELEHEVRRLVCLAADSEAITEAVVDAARVDTRLDQAATTADDAVLGNDLDLQTLERQAILEALRRSGGRRTAASRLLGITRHTLRRRLKRHGLPTD